MVRQRLRRLSCCGVSMLLLTAGWVAATSAPVAASGSGSGSCLPAQEQVVTNPGDFTASTAGSGVGDVSIEPATGPSSAGTGRLAWSVRQVVTGNTDSPGASMTGSMTLSITLGGQSISFVSSCILESGVFAGETEADPFGPETPRVVVKGVEGEWIGTAYNLSGSGTSSDVVASLAVWTTSAGPRFHLDMTTAAFSPGQCPAEGGTTTSVSAGGPTGTSGSVTISAPGIQAGRGACVQQQQQQDPG